MRTIIDCIMTYVYETLISGIAENNSWQDVMKNMSWNTLISGTIFSVCFQLLVFLRIDPFVSLFIYFGWYSVNQMSVNMYS